MSDRAEKDVQQHNAEMKEMVRVVDRDRRLREFMSIKSKELVEDQQLVAWRIRKGRFPVIQLFINLSKRQNYVATLRQCIRMIVR